MKMLLLLSIAARWFGQEPSPAVRTLEGHGSSVMAVAFSPDGMILASSSRTGELRRTLTGHEGRIESLAFSPGGNTLATGGGGGDTSVKLWDVSGLKE